MDLGNDVNHMMIIDRELDNDKNTGLMNVNGPEILETLYHLECAISATYASKVEKNNWNYIPFSHLAFFKGLSYVTKRLGTTDLSFLELGCGLGTKLYIASKWVGIKFVAGVEVVREYVEIARNMLDSCNVDVYHSDVRDFRGYDHYDIIYTYGEVLSQNESWHLERKLKEKMKVGAVLMTSFVGGMALWRKQEQNDYEATWQLDWKMGKLRRIEPGIYAAGGVEIHRSVSKQTGRADEVVWDVYFHGKRQVMSYNTKKEAVDYCKRKGWL